MKDNSTAARLIYQRKLKGYSQQELAQRTNVTVRTIQRIESGEVAPHLQTVKLLAAALEIEPNELLALENPNQESIQLKWLLLMHGTPLIGIMIPFLNVLIPLFLWIHKREDNEIYDIHGRAIINFHITATILFILSFVALLTIEGYGFLFFIAVIPLVAAVVIFNIFSVLKTQKCYYPLSYPFVRSANRSQLPGLVLLVICSTLFAGQDNLGAQSIVRLDGSTITKESISKHLGDLIIKANVHGMAVAVFDDYKLSYQEAFGFKNYEDGRLLTDSTNLYGASLSKAIFSVLVMKLVEKGVIELDVPLETYLPKKIYQYEPLTRWHDDFSDLTQDTLYHKITARMCLDHTSGFPNWRWFEPDQKLRVKFEPGGRYSYSGEGFVYLQVVIEKLTNRGLEELAQDLVFKPLGMTRSSYQWQEAFENDFAYGHKPSAQAYQKDTDNEPRAGSTLETTFQDYNKFLVAVLNKKLISESSWAEIFKPQVRIRSLRQFGPMSKVDSTLYDHIELSYGLGWGIIKTPYGQGCFKEGGGNGFKHYSIIFPEAGKGVLIMSNSDNAEGIFKKILAVTIADTFTPWQWNNYVPYDSEI